ncbi:hypothetical protein DYB26_009664 [Aphanomyces astaci]|uniref:Uncharacterized protein n=1 Tax=Aphanomyces astaci TaxID=112090 RepID=A0A397F9V3_APHAT|nr:hypothetical protein DYB26_009664 [Aphanomyces astaci]RHZ15466.1 hypothetical protein DYB31_002914 [Aphanomyces astaci]
MRPSWCSWAASVPFRPTTFGTPATAVPSPSPCYDISYVALETWTMVKSPVPWSPRGWHCAFVFNRRLWVTGGSPLNNEVWSTDSVLQGCLNLHPSLPSRRDDMVSSYVPGHWVKMPSPAWPARAAHSCVNHQLKNATLGDVSTQDVVFLLAGWGQNSNLFNDVYMDLTDQCGAVASPRVDRRTVV